MNSTYKRVLLSGHQARECREFLQLDVGPMALLIGSTDKDILRWESAPDKDRVPALYSRRIKHAVTVEQAKRKELSRECNILEFLPLED